MQFLLLLLTNIFLGAVLYLVISLKLEKKSSEYTEKKFRKEMDDIMREFNSAADRNISLLENKIEVLKKLLERSGQLKSVDFTVGKMSKLNDPMEKDEKKEKIIENDHHLDLKKTNENIPVNKNHKLKKSLLIFINKIILFYKKFKGLNNKLEIDTGLHFDNNDLIEIDYQNMKSKEPVNEKIEQNNEKLTEDEILDIVSSSENMNTLITCLFDNGCSIENISKYSGIPVGEIKLVLNLNNAR